MRRFMASLLAGLLASSGVVAVALVDAAPAAAASGPAGSFAAVTPSRVADTRTGLAGNRRGAIPAQGAATFQIAGKAGVPRGTESVALMITAVAPVATGYLVAYRAGARLPGTVTSYFTRGLTVTTSTTPLLSSTGRLNIANLSPGPLHVIIEVTGYFRPGRTGAAGSYGAVNPARFLDTRTGVGARRAVVGTGRAVNVQVTGRGGVPRGASAVVATLSAVSPTGSGGVVAGAAGSAVPAVSQVAVVAGRNAADQVVVPLSASGALTIRNGTRGRVHLTLDVLGYYRPGFAAEAGYFSLTRASRIASVAVGARRSAGITIEGAGGVPASNVAAVVGTLTAIGPAAAGAATVYPTGVSRPNATHLNFGRAASTADLVVVPVGIDGRIVVFNNAPRSVRYTFDIAGYVLQSDLPPVAVSRSHYVRNLVQNNDPSNVAAMDTVGCADATAGSTLILLHLGAQSVHPPLSTGSPGVLLSNTQVRLTYPQLVSALTGYLDGWSSCRSVGTSATVVVGTNNDGQFDPTQQGYYDPLQRGVDWLARLVAPLRSHGAPLGITVVGGNDIESEFAGSGSDVAKWTTGYLSDPNSGELVFNGAAIGCPFTPGATSGSCSHGWTEAQYYWLAGGKDPRIRVLPQIYTPAQAVQWANIDATGGGGLRFLGALTEYAACPTVSADCTFASFAPTTGWAALQTALSRIGITLPLVATDLDVLS